MKGEKDEAFAQTALQTSEGRSGRDSRVFGSRVRSVFSQQVALRRRRGENTSADIHVHFHWRKRFYFFCSHCSIVSVSVMTTDSYTVRRVPIHLRFHDLKFTHSKEIAYKQTEQASVNPYSHPAFQDRSFHVRRCGL